jgi:hypothetical protein
MALEAKEIPMGPKRTKGKRSGITADSERWTHRELISAPALFTYHSVVINFIQQLLSLTSLLALSTFKECCHFPQPNQS